MQPDEISLTQRRELDTMPCSVSIRYPNANLHYTLRQYHDGEVVYAAKVKVLDDFKMEIIEELTQEEIVALDENIDDSILKYETEEKERHLVNVVHAAYGLKVKE
jgi:hypothetical protein